MQVLHGDSAVSHLRLVQKPEALCTAMHCQCSDCTECHLVLLETGSSCEHRVLCMLFLKRRHFTTLR